MPDASDMDLVREYLRSGSETAFAELVRRHVNLVYSVALRQVGMAAQAEEIAQVVFIILARKGGRLRPDTVLEGWLHETTRLTALSFMRGERRRQFREQEAYMQSTLTESGPDTAWNRLSPILDEGISRLGKKDRDAVMLRFFKGKSVRETAAALNVKEAAVQRRVRRAVEKLRRFFTRRGVVVPAAALTAALAANSVQAAPVTLAKAATTLAVAKGATASGSTSLLVKGALKLIAWTNVKTAVALGVAAILAVGTSATLIVESQSKAGVYFSRATWANAGYADPEATVKTLVWAISRNDGKAIFASLSPDCQEEFRQLGAQKTPPISPERFIIQFWTGKMGELSEFGILKTNVISEASVMLDVSGRMGRKSADQWIAFRKIDGEWKCDDFAPDSNTLGRSGLQPAHAEYGGVGVLLQLDKTTSKVRIKGIVPKSPAERARLAPGLIVKAINGTSTAKKTAAECVFLTRGLVGRNVRLELINPERNETNLVELQRQRWTR